MKILVIDDEPLVRRSLQRAFENKGHKIELAENGKIGLNKWIEVSPDIVFLDVLMPEMNGIEVLAKRPSKSKAKIVLMTAYTGEKVINQDTLSQVDLYLQKPFENIFQVVEQVEKLK